MPSPPAVSILMPVRNEELYLQSALDSLFRQTFPSWELVVIDDGSSDATASILASAAQKDTRIRPLQPDGRGLVAALNTGLANCRAPLVARMDGDDICHPRRLELQVEYLRQNPEVSLVACNFRHFPRKGLKPGMVAYETWQNSLNSHERIMQDLFVESPFVHPSITCRRSILDQVNGYRDCGWAEDYDLWLRLAQTGARFARLPDTLFFWRDHPERATRTLNEYSSTAFRRCRLDHLKDGFLKGINRVAIAGAGLEGRAWQRLLVNHNISVVAWIDVDPRKIGRTLHGSPVFSADYVGSLHEKILVCIGVRGAREKFRQLIAPMELQEGLDFLCVS